MKKIVIFASGKGSNAENIIKYFENNLGINVVAICSNKTDALVLERATHHNISSFVFNKTAFYKTNYVQLFLEQINPDMIILAGFLWKIPSALINAFKNKIINLHPSLLPKYGGKGMYGNYVHKAVLENKELQSGITIHYVNDYYDEGEVIFQKSVLISENETVESLSEKIHTVEHKYFPKIIAQLLLEL